MRRLSESNVLLERHIISTDCSRSHDVAKQYGAIKRKRHRLVSFFLLRLQARYCRTGARYKLRQNKNTATKFYPSRRVLTLAERTGFVRSNLLRRLSESNVLLERHIISTDCSRSHDVAKQYGAIKRKRHRLVSFFLLRLQASHIHGGENRI